MFSFGLIKVVRVESLEKPGHQILLANTHLFFHPKADFIRLLQAIVCGKHIEKLKYTLLKEEKDIKDLSILFGGDFNSGKLIFVFLNNKNAKDSMIISTNIILNVNQLNAMAHLTTIVDLKFALETNLNVMNTII